MFRGLRRSVPSPVVVGISDCSLIDGLSGSRGSATFSEYYFPAWSIDSTLTREFEKVGEG
jgi:hypothetical protein